MDERSKIHVGLDVHKDSITVAAADPGRDKARLIGRVAHDLPKVLKVLAKLGAPEELAPGLRGRAHRVWAAARLDCQGL